MAAREDRLWAKFENAVRDGSGGVAQANYNIRLRTLYTHARRGCHSRRYSLNGIAVCVGATRVGHSSPL